MATRKVASIVTGIVLALLVCGCSESFSGGGVGGTGKQIVQNRLIVGVVDGFGSIIVNNQRFESDNAEIYINGGQAHIADLSIGMRLAASVDTISGTALELYYQPDVVGPVQSIDTENGVLVILGQTVLFDENTVLDNVSPSMLGASQWIEVSGNRNAYQEIVATFIRTVSVDQAMYAVGVLELDVDSNDLFIGGAEIDLQSAAILRAAENSFSQFMITDTPVRVTVSDGSSKSSLVASSFETIQSPSYKAGDAIQMLGIVSANSDQSTYHVDGIEFSIDDETWPVSKFGLPVEFPNNSGNQPVLIDGIAQVDNGTVLTNVVRFLDQN